MWHFSATRVWRIFSNGPKVATDIRICCAFFKAEVDQIFVDSRYTKIVRELSREERTLSFDNISIEGLNFTKVLQAPFCNRFIYQKTISTQPFRVCDEKNFGMSQLCSLEAIIIKPQMWGKQFLDRS